MNHHLTTRQLLDFLNGNHHLIEASLLLNFGGRATHFISRHQAIICDEGIDDELVRWQPADFLAHYHDASWSIQQIIALNT